jgi:hypothetical protein
MDQRDRHGFPVRRRAEQAACHIQRGVEAARHLLAFQEHAVAGNEVVIPDLVRRRHRGINEPDRVGVEFVAGIGAQRIRLLGEGHGVLDAGCDLAHDQARVGVLPLQPHQMARERDMEQHHGSLAIWDQVAPMFPRGARNRRCDELEILRPVRVGADDQIAAVVLHVVDDLVFASRDKARLGIRIVPVEQIGFRGLVVVRRDDDEGVRVRLVEIDEPALVGLLVDQRIVALLCADVVTAHAHGPVVFVDFHIVEARRIATPHRLARGGGQHVLQVPPRREITNPDRVQLRARDIGRPDKTAVIG